MPVIGAALRAGALLAAVALAAGCASHATPPRKPVAGQTAAPSQIGSTSPASRSGSTIPASGYANPTCLDLVPAAYGPTVGPGAAASAPVPADIIDNFGSTTVNNAAGGPGTSRNSAGLAIIRHEQDAGITVLGYIWTDYDNSSTAHDNIPITGSQIEQQMRDWKNWYGVTDYFLDGVPDTSSQASFYMALYDYAHSLTPGDSVWINPGVYPAEGYMNASDVIVDWENTTLPDTPPSWVFTYPASRFANVIHSYRGDVITALNAIRADHAQHAYVADTSDYSALPSYWPTEVSNADNGCN